MGIFVKKYLWVVTVFLIFVATYFLAKTAANLIGAKIRTPKKYLAAPMRGGDEARTVTRFDDYQIILDRNIFNSQEVATQSPSEEAAPDVNLDGPAVKSSLPVKLISTFSVGDGTDRRSSATVTSSASTAGVEIYTVEDEQSFAPGVKLKKILPDRIEFVNGSRLEYVEIETFGGGVNTGEPTSAQVEDGGEPRNEGRKIGIEETTQGKFAVDRAEIQAALSNMDQLMTQIRAVPQFKDGKTTGLRLLNVRSGSLFGKLGLQRNDVLEQINGQPVDIKKGIEVFEQLKDADRISIDLMRGGKKTTLEYSIQ